MGSLTHSCIGAIELGQVFKVECIDYSGGQVINDDCADDVLDLDHDSDHHLSGPFHVPGAEPGDVLEIDILEWVAALHYSYPFLITLYGASRLLR